MYFKEIFLTFTKSIKMFKMSLFTLHKKRKEASNFIWKVMHETVSEWWKNHVDPCPQNGILLGLKDHSARTLTWFFSTHLSFWVRKKLKNWSFIFLYEGCQQWRMSMSNFIQNLHSVWQPNLVWCSIRMGLKPNFFYKQFPT